MHDHAITQPQLPAIIPSTELVALRARMRPVSVVGRRVADVVMDVVILLAIILSIPFIVLAVGIPVALVAQLVLLIGRHL